METKALAESNRAVARPGGKEAGVKAMSPRTETGYEAGDADELAPHSEVLDSLPQVTEENLQSIPEGCLIFGSS